MSEYRAFNYSLRDSNNLWQLDYIRENSQKVFLVILISALCYTFFIAPFYLVIKPSMPETSAEQYITYLKNKDYQKAIECYTAIPPGDGTGYNYIKSALENKYNRVNDINVRSVKRSPKAGQYEVLIEARNDRDMIEDTIRLFNTASSLLGIKKEWKIIFPFKTRDIVIDSADGAVILIDGIESGQVKGGKLTVRQVICDMHTFEAKLEDIAKSEKLITEVGESTGALELKLVFNEEFRKSIDKLLSDFVNAWSDYCLTQNSEKLKPFLTDRLHKEYTKDSDRFNGSKYVVSECSLEQGELETGSINAVTYTIEEKWHLKEVITSPELVFKDNYKSQLEQTQYIKSKYQIVKDNGIWKIDSVKQLDFKQEIKK